MTRRPDDIAGGYREKRRTIDSVRLVLVDNNKSCQPKGFGS